MGACSNSWKTLAALGAAATALAAGTGVAAAAEKKQVTPDSRANSEPAAEAYVQAFPGIDPRAAQDAVDGEDRRKELYLKLTGEHAATYGGAWFDPPSGVTHVATTSREAAARAEQLGSELGLRVQTHLVRRTLTVLERKADKLRNGTDELARNANQQVGIDVQSNTVVAAVPPDRLGAKSSKKPPEGVAVVGDPGIKTEEDAGCTSRAACDWTVRAGAMLWRSSAGNNVCSVGFTARNSSNTRFVYTAGHCSSGNGVNWGTGALSIGPLQASVNSGVLDVAIIRVTNSWFTGDLGGEIYLNSAAGKTVPLNGAAPTVNYMLQGERVCKSPNFTQPNGPNFCGVIGAVSDPAVRGMTRVDGLDACPGDSGGGWYWLTNSNRRIAYGIHSRSDEGCHGSQGGSRSWYTPIALAKSNFAPSLNVEVRP